MAATPPGHDEKIVFVFVFEAIAHVERINHAIQIPDDVGAVLVRWDHRVMALTSRSKSVIRRCMSSMPGSNNRVVIDDSRFSRSRRMSPRRRKLRFNIVNFSSYVIALVDSSFDFISLILMVMGGRMPSRLFRFGVATRSPFVGRRPRP